jgi:hypothetical protein
MREVRLWAERADGAIGLDLTWRARTRPYALRRGTMRAGHDLVWDQSHILQSGTYTGTYTFDGTAREVAGWIGQRDHSWGIRDHGRCPLWLWWQIQLDDGFLGVWHWELPNGALVYRDGCWAGADMSEPVPVVDFRYDATWVGADGTPAAYGEHGDAVAGLVASAAFTLADRRTIEVEAEQRRPHLRTVPPGRAQPHAGPHGRRTPGHRHLRGHRRPPPPLLPRHGGPGGAARMTIRGAGRRRNL